MSNDFVVSGVVYIVGVVEAPSGLQAREKFRQQGALALTNIRDSYSPAESEQGIEARSTWLHMNGIRFEDGTSAAYYFEPNDVQREHERQVELQMESITDEQNITEIKLFKAYQEALDAESLANRGTSQAIAVREAFFAWTENRSRGQK